MRFLRSILLAAQAVAAISVGHRKAIVPRTSDGLQDVVTYDQHSLMIHGERIFIFSGEFHPYRLPVPGMWLDIFQKVKSLGFGAVSFYTDWALFEGEPGVYNASGVFDLVPFFDAASDAGIYLIARPGPYINAESSGGGFPGWMQRTQSLLRTSNPAFLDATNNYVANVASTIAAAQITNGGPVILYQIENEYSQGTAAANFPDPAYFAFIEAQTRNASVIVPFVSNDASPHGFFAPGSSIDGTMEGDVNIYGFDSYPLGFDCANPTVWPSGSIPTSFFSTHQAQSPTTYDSINEFQGGSFDPWGGPGFSKCAQLLNHEFARVFYKNNFAAATSFLNIYMIFGGTNWGNLGHSGGYTSYDYGAAISEDRTLTREKFSELKLEAQFLKVTPAFLSISVGALSTGVFTNGDITTTPLTGNGTATNLYVLRHSNFAQTTASSYVMQNIKTSLGTIATIPQLGGQLTMSGRDSKWFVTDYDLGGTTLLYSTAEIFTWKKFSDKTVLVVYGGPNELHELAVVSTSQAKTLEGSGVTTQAANGTQILNWQTSTTRRVVQIGSLFVYILDRNTAYNYWVPDFPRTDVWGNFNANIGNTTSVIVQAGYLIRGVSTVGTQLHITGDLNATVPFKVIGAPPNIESLFFNGEAIRFRTDSHTGEMTSTLVYDAPSLELPDLSTLAWKTIDNLPEIQPGYDDSLWIHANLNKTFNTFQAQITPTSLFGSDYGFHTGVLLFRGHFTALGTESSFFVNTIGGNAFGSSVFLNNTYIGSWPGIDRDESHNDTYTLPNLIAGANYVLTILVDNNGLDENFSAGTDSMKTPRGILDFGLNNQPKSAISWKITGNLGGEHYADKVRGPLNEGGLFAERQGFTQPNPPSETWASGSPLTGIGGPGVAFYAAPFTLDLPTAYDIPLVFTFGNTTINGATADYRAQLWVNGYQFGKYTNNIGPQTSFPVPQGILNYQGENWVGIELWAQQASGANLASFTLSTSNTPLMSSFSAPALVPMPSFKLRPGAF